MMPPTNSLGSKGIKSSSFSPTPTYNIGSFKALTMPKRAPPLAVPSSLVMIIASIPTSS